jgi:hypothetical protein
MSESETPRTDVQRRLAGAFDQDGMVGMAAHAEQLERELAAAKAWKDAVIEKLAITWAITSENENCPQKAIDDLVASQVAIALDPAVSSDAAALIERGRQEMRAEVERLRGIVPEYLRRDLLDAANDKAEMQHEINMHYDDGFWRGVESRDDEVEALKDKLAAAKAEIEALRADAADFHMAYRIRGGHLAVASEMIDSLRAEVEALRAVAQSLVDGTNAYGDGGRWSVNMQTVLKARAALAKEKSK